MAEGQANPSVEAAKKESAELKKKQQEQYDKMAKAKPTPTQDQNDRAKLGEIIKEHEDDGSEPDPFRTPKEKEK
jgi:hypothetical protein